MLPGGATLALDCREDIGLFTLVYGGFETAEVEFLMKRAARGSVAVDVGANVGVFTIPLAQVVGPTGSVLAFEPDPANVARLSQNMDRNGIENVRVFSVACAAHDGEVNLNLGRDAAYNSVGSVNSRQQTGWQIRVPSARLDRIWEDCGSPAVSVMKLDVEGEELEVLKGATGLLTQSKPLLMIEAIDADHYKMIHDWLAVRGYHPIRGSGFMPWNYLFDTGSAD